MSERHGPCGDSQEIGTHGGPDDRHCRVCTDKTCHYNKPSNFQVRLADRVEKGVVTATKRYPVLFFPLCLLGFLLSPIKTTRNVLGPSWRVIQEYGGVREIVRMWWRNRC